MEISKLNNNVFLEEKLKPDLNEIEKIFIADAEELLSPINHFRIKSWEYENKKQTFKPNLPIKSFSNPPPRNFPQLKTIQIV